MTRQEALAVYRRHGLLSAQFSVREDVALKLSELESTIAKLEQQVRHCERNHVECEMRERNALLRERDDALQQLDNVTVELATALQQCARVAAEREDIAESRHRAEMLALEVMTERDALRTRLDAVERLANQWSKCASDGMLPAAAESIRAALATDAPASHDWRPELGKLVRVRSTGEVGRCINLDGLLAAVELDEIRWIAVNCLEPTVASPERGTGGEDFEPPCGRCKGRGVMWHERLERDVLCTYCQTKPVANATSRVKEP